MYVYAFVYVYRTQNRLAGFLVAVVVPCVHRCLVSLLYMYIEPKTGWPVFLWLLLCRACIGAWTRSDIAGRRGWWLQILSYTKCF